MTTRVELQKWLDQFPADANMKVLSISECLSHFGHYTSVAEMPLVLSELPKEMGSYYIGESFEIEIDSQGKVSVFLGHKE